MRSLLLALMITGTAIAADIKDAVVAAPQNYKVEFENEHVQTVYIHYGPHEKSVMHSHPAGVLVYLTDGHFRFTDATGKTFEASAKRGEARWFDAFSHKVENLDDKGFDAVYVVVKTKH